MRRVIKALIFSAAVAAVAAPAQARAEGYVNPWAGVSFGSNVDNGRGTFGVNAGAMGAGIVGGEVSFGYSPSFFGTQNDFGNNTLIDLMANLIVGIPMGGTDGPGIRPFVTGGIGLIRTQIDGGTFADVESRNNMAGWNAGAGLMGYFNDHVGLRGEVRYHRGFEDLDFGFADINEDASGFHYWRGTIGVVIR